MENIIKKAIDGGYKVKEKTVHNQIGYKQVLVCDPLFWQALGDSCGWNDTNHFRLIGGVGHLVEMETGNQIPVWEKSAIQFHKINLTEGWEKAMKYLKDLLTKERK